MNHIQNMLQAGLLAIVLCLLTPSAHADRSVQCHLTFEKLGLCGMVSNWVDTDHSKQSQLKGPIIGRKLSFELRFYDPNAGGPVQFIDPTRPASGEDRQLHAYLWMTMSDDRSKDSHGSPKPLKNVKMKKVNGSPLANPTNAYLDMAGTWWLKVAFTTLGVRISRKTQATTLLGNTDEEALIDDAAYWFQVSPGVFEQKDMGPSPLPNIRAKDMADLATEVQFERGKNTLIIFLGGQQSKSGDVSGCPCSQLHQQHLNTLLYADDGMPRFNDLQIVGVANPTPIESETESHREQATRYFAGDAGRMQFPMIYDEKRTIATYYENTTGTQFTTPYVLLFNERGFLAEKHLLFQGSPFDHWNPDRATVEYLQENLEALEEGKQVPHQKSSAKGCFIHRE